MVIVCRLKTLKSVVYDLLWHNVSLYLVLAIVQKTIFLKNKLGCCSKKTRGSLRLKIEQEGS